MTDVSRETSPDEAFVADRGRRGGEQLEQARPGAEAAADGGAPAEGAAEPSGGSPEGEGHAEVDTLRARYAWATGMASFAELLAGPGMQRGLIGPREVARIWPRHLANCAVVAEQVSEAMPYGARVADVGSGAGLPGLVWALVREDLDVTLIEPLLRRATFLAEAVDELGLAPRVRVLRERAESVDGRFDVVTARAVARLPQLARWTLPLTEVGGWVVALKGSSASQELDEAEGVIAALGGGTPRIELYGEGVLADPTTVVLIPRVSEGSARQDRRRMGGGRRPQ